jgi:uncharacterized protein YjbI with pentapeptide repeats
MSDPNNQSADDFTKKPVVVRSASLANSPEKFELNFDEEFKLNFDEEGSETIPSSQEEGLLSSNAVSSVEIPENEACDDQFFKETVTADSDSATLRGTEQVPSFTVSYGGNSPEYAMASVMGNGKSSGTNLSPYVLEKEATIVSDNGTLAVPMEARLTELSPATPPPPEALTADPNPESIQSPVEHEPEDEVLSQAKSGSAEAIEALLNRELQNHDLQVVEVYFRGDRLQLTVEGPTGAPQELVEQTLRPWLIQLKLSTVRIIELFGQKAGEDLPLWRVESELAALEQMDLNDLALPSLDEVNAVSNAKQEEVAAFLAQYESGERVFHKINLSEAALAGAVLTLADLQEAVFTWADLSGASLYHVNLNYAKLRFANLTHAKLRSANLQGTDFTSANLTGADLSWANLRGANLTGANLTDANLQNAVLERVVMPDGTLLD